MNSDALMKFLSRKGWTLTHLAAKSGVSRSTLHRLINGQFLPSAKTAKALSEATGISIATLLRTNTTTGGTAA